MSMSNARKQWKTLALLAAMFVGLFLLGPLLIYGLPVIGDFLLSIHPLVYLLVLGTLPAAWCVFSLWFGEGLNRGTPNTPSAEKLVGECDR